MPYWDYLGVQCELLPLPRHYISQRRNKKSEISAPNMIGEKFGDEDPAKDKEGDHKKGQENKRRQTWEERQQQGAARGSWWTNHWLCVTLDHSLIHNSLGGSGKNSRTSLRKKVCHPSTLTEILTKHCGNIKNQPTSPCLGSLGLTKKVMEG